MRCSWCCGVGEEQPVHLIVGTNERAVEFARQIVGHPELDIWIVGFVDDDWTVTRAFESTGHARCCTFTGLADFLRHNVIDEAAISCRCVRTTSMPLTW